MLETMATGPATGRIACYTKRAKCHVDGIGQRDLKREGRREVNNANWIWTDIYRAAQLTTSQTIVIIIIIQLQRH